jgi:hypothetical protein
MHCKLALRTISNGLHLAVGLALPEYALVFEERVRLQQGNDLATQLRVLFSQRVDLLFQFRLLGLDLLQPIFN